MSNVPTREEACRRLGIPDRELVEILDAPAGIMYVTVDGNALIDVPADRPDFDGKTGLMFASAPAVPGGYKGDFPVFTNPPAEPDAVAVVGADVASMSKGELLDHARQLGIDAQAKWSKGQLLEVIAEHTAVAPVDSIEVPADAVPETVDPS